MNYIVFDLEFNMFFRFKEGDAANPDLKNEIIQIGAVKLNEVLEPVASLNLRVKPAIYKRLNPYVKKKINLNTRSLAGGLPFMEAINRFHSWLGNDPVLCSWGHDDILGLKQNCLYYGYDNLQFNKFIDIQKIYMMTYDLANQPALEAAVENLAIERDFSFHDALGDASYTTAIFRKIYNFAPEAILNWEKVQRENELKIAELRNQIDKAVMTCPECHSIIEKSGEITKAKKYFAFGHCKRCDIPIRQISRIAQQNGDYIIVTKNNVYKIREA